jgi:hypothetical protein
MTNATADTAKARPRAARAPSPCTDQLKRTKRGIPAKSDILVTCLSRPEGATIAQMCQATGWLPHSVRGFMAGALKKRFGQAVTAEVTEAGRIYRIVKSGGAS